MGKYMTRRRQRRQEEPFQMAPMIDMVFLLLVFFMTVSTLAKEARPEIELPLSGTATVPETAPPRDIITVIPGEDSMRIFWHSRLVSEEALEGLLQAHVAGEAGHELTVRCPPDLPWSQFREVLDRIRAAGIGNIIIATFET